MRSIDSHSCPAEAKQARIAPSAAFFGSASSSTSIGFLPPSSSEHPTSRAAACAAMVRPVEVEPV